MLNSSLSNQHRIIIGIDPGTETGFAVWDKLDREFREINSCKIHEALRRVLEYQRNHWEELFVRFEDARLRTWFGNTGPEKWKGAGSIMRDCSIWQDFLQDNGVHFAGMAPRIGLTKMPADKFKAFTGWQWKTNNHGRDAAMLVYGY